jgi:hypothetical protein
MSNIDICIIGNTSLFDSDHFLDSVILRNKTICPNIDIQSNNIVDDEKYTNNINQLEKNLYYTESVWASFALNKNIKKIICFEKPNRGLPIFKYYGLTSNIILLSNENLNKSILGFLNMAVKKKINYGMKLFNPIRTSSQINNPSFINDCNYIFYFFTPINFKIIYHEVDNCLNKKSYIQLPCVNPEKIKQDKFDRYNLLMEWMGRNLHKYFKHLNFLTSDDKLVVGIYYKDNGYYCMKYGIPSHPLKNMSLDEFLIHAGLNITN